MPTIRATFDGSVLVPDSPLDLPAGTVVEFEPRAALDHVDRLSDLASLFDDDPDAPTNLAARRRLDPHDLPDSHPLEGLMGIVRTAPTDPNSPRDRAAHHDHYLYGCPKRPENDTR